MTKLYSKETKEIFLLGSMAACQSIFFNISNIIIASEINKYGAAVTAGNTAASNICDYVYFIMNAFSVAAMAVISQNHGARKFDRVRKTLIYSIASVIVLAGSLSSLVIVFRMPLLSILVRDGGNLDVTEVYKAGSDKIITIGSVYFTCGVMECMCSYYRGLKFSVTPTIITLTGSVILRILFIFTLYQLPQFHTYAWLLSTLPLSWTITIGIYWIFYPSYTRKATSRNLNWRENALKEN